MSWVKDYIWVNTIFHTCQFRLTSWKSCAPEMKHNYMNELSYMNTLKIICMICLRLSYVHEDLDRYGTYCFPPERPHHHTRRRRSQEEPCSDSSEHQSRSGPTRSLHSHLSGKWCFSVFPIELKSGLYHFTQIQWHSFEFNYTTWYDILYSLLHHIVYSL